jgi:hypothetical protein
MQGRDDAVKTGGTAVLMKPAAPPFCIAFLNSATVDESHSRVRTRTLQATWS